MNALIANSAMTIALLASAAALAPATANAGDIPAAAASVLVVDCATKSRPSQVAVGQLLGINNLSQVYEARSRLMAEVHRACHRSGARQVQIVSASSRKRPNPASGQVAALTGSGDRKAR